VLTQPADTLLPEHNVGVGGILGQLRPDETSRIPHPGQSSGSPGGTASGLTPSTATTDVSGTNCSRPHSFRHEKE
jgi:hypothetical protein